MNSLFQLVEYIKLAESKFISLEKAITVSQSKNYFIFRYDTYTGLYRKGKGKPILTLGDQWLRYSLDMWPYPEEFISQKEYHLAKEMDEVQLILTYGRGVSVDEEMLEDIRLYVENL